MNTREILNIDCLHESQGISTNIVVPDYNPIAPEELAELMTLATSTDDNQLRNQIQIRLGKGIPGMACPHPIEGIVADKSAQVDHLYMDEITNGRSANFMSRYYEIISGTDQNS